MSLTIKNKLKIQLTINIFLILISLFFIINFILIYFNISKELTENYLIGNLLVNMILAPFIAISGGVNFYFYDKYKKIIKNKYKKIFVISLIFSFIPILIILAIFENFGT